MFAVGHFEGGIFGGECFETLVALKFVREIHFKFTVLICWIKKLRS